jgi:cytochrome c biogenesis protein CcmG/thiol:disulfide interchange protein DsbE
VNRVLPTTVVLGVLAIVVVFAFYGTNRHQARFRKLQGASTERPLAPDFSLPELNGHQLNLSDYRGKVVLLDFWATWCEPCRVETPHFVELQNKYSGRGLQVIGVSMDDGPEPVREFYQQFKMNYPVVMGDAKTGEIYGGVLGLPIAFLIGRDGRISSRHIGATDNSSIDRRLLWIDRQAPQAPSRRFCFEAHRCQDSTFVPHLW